MADSPKKIRFQCEHCDYTIKTNASHAGRKGRCPKCGQSIKIPSAETLKSDEEKDVGSEGDPDVDFNFDDIDDIISQAKEARAEPTAISGPDFIILPEGEVQSGNMGQPPNVGLTPVAGSTVPPVGSPAPPTDPSYPIQPNVSGTPIENPGERRELPGLPEHVKDEFDIRQAVREMDEPENLPMMFGGPGTSPHDADGDGELDTIPLDGESDSDETDYSGVFGVKCHVCDTRIHVTPDKIGTEVECPDCFTKVKVEGKPKPHREKTWKAKADSKAASAKFGDDADELKLKSDSSATDEPEVETEDDMLKLSDPVERPKTDLGVVYGIEDGIGLEPVAEDLLTPTNPVVDWDENSPPALEIVNDPGVAEDYGIQMGELPTSPPPVPQQYSQQNVRQPETASNSSPSPEADSEPKRKRKKRRSRREAFEETNDPEDVSKSAGFVKGEIDREPFSFEKALSLLTGFFSGSAIMLVLLVFGLLAASAVVYDLFASDGDLKGMEMVFQFLMQVGLAGVLWMAGTVCLLYVGGVFFRDAALGHRSVQAWKPGSFEEIRDTTLLFGFGFYPWGLPFTGLAATMDQTFVKLFFGGLIAPLRMLVAPVALVGAWFNQSPIGLVAPEIWKQIGRDSREWIGLYSIVAVLAFGGFIAGILLYTTYFILAFIGAGIYTLVTLLFAALAGWHAGRIVDRIENPEQYNFDSES